MTSYLHSFTVAAAAAVLAWCPSLVRAQGTPTEIRHVAQEDLTSTFTARDVIGKSVVNHAGERLGTINDVGLSKEWVERFGAPGAADTKDEESQPEGAQLLVYVSTGGLLGLQGRLGMAADWVSVPAERLLYDRSQDRFILNVPAAQFTAIAQGRARTEADAPTEEARPTSTGRETSGRIGATSNPGRGIGDAGLSEDARQEVRAIEEALASHRELRTEKNIRVAHTGSGIELSGSVARPELIRRAGDVAREHTELEVRNLLEVRRTAE